jgi:hypothetical protein
VRLFRHSGAVAAVAEERRRRGEREGESLAAERVRPFLRVAQGWASPWLVLLRPKQTSDGGTDEAGEDTTRAMLQGQIVPAQWRPWSLPLDSLRPLA